MTTTTSRPADARRSEGRPRMDPRVRARRAEVARDQGRRRLRVLIAMAVVAVLSVGAWWLLHSSLFSARVVTVVGAVHEPDAAVVAAGGLASHPPLIALDSTKVVAGIDRLPWVASVTLTRHWPDGVRITVVERTPVALIALPAPTRSGRAVAPVVAEIDRSGRVLADLPAPPSGLVGLTVPGPPGPPGTTLPGADLGGVVVASSLPPAFAGQVGSVQVVAGGSVLLHLSAPVSVNLGDTSQLPQKYEDVASLLAGASLHAGDVIDVSVPDSPTVTSS